MSAYAFFVQTCREEHKKKHPDESVVFAEFSKKCSERWRTMTDKEKKRFNDMADRDKGRYDREMVGYVPPKGEKGGKKRKKKDPNAPKRAMSAFFWFCQEERGKVRAANPDLTVGDTAKELGRRWAEVTTAQKGKFEALAQKDKKRYEAEMKVWKGGASGSGTKRQKKPEQPAQVEDDDEEEDEEEEDEEDDE